MKIQSQPILKSSIIYFTMQLHKLILLLTCCLYLVNNSIAATKHFYVSPTGNDRSPGTLAQPFRTISHARDAVRIFRTQHSQFNDTVCVILRGGRYYLQEPLLFDYQDGGTRESPTVYTSYPGEHPVISGGQPIKGWKEGTLHGKRVLTAALPHNEKSPSVVRQLWVNGIRRTPARYPNIGYLQVANAPDATAKTDWMDGQKSFIPRSGDITASMDFRGAEAVVMNRWVESHLPVDHYDIQSNLLSFTRRSVFRLEKGDPFYLIHVRSALDTCGEWYHDIEKGVLYYIPTDTEKSTSIDAVTPLQTQLLRVSGNIKEGKFVDHLMFRSVEFSHTEWHFPQNETDSRNKDAGGFVQAATGVPAAIEWEGVRFSSLERCTLSHLGTYGISLGEGCRENRIAECEMSDLGAGGMKIGMKTIATDSLTRTSNNVVINNHIHHGGRIFHSAIGIWVGQSPQNRFIHNHIHDFYYSGFSIGWTWGYGPADAAGNIVEMNHVHHIGVMSDGDGPILSDLGGIYTLGNHRGTIIRNNVFHDISARVYGGWGIYFDEGTTGLLAENNIVYRTIHGGFHQHYGRENIVRNNIFAFGKEQQIQRSRPENHTSFAFEKNIIIWREGKVIQGNMRDGDAVLDRNLYWPLKGEFRIDSLNFEGWQKFGYDRHSKIADPLFVNPETENFSLKQGSPAFALGFKPIDVTNTLSGIPMKEPGTTEKKSVGRNRFLYNNDGSNILMAYDTLTPKRAYERIDPIANTGITTFLHNVNPGQNMGYASSAAQMYHWDPPPNTPREGWGKLGLNMSNNLACLTSAGIDPVALVLDRARLRGFETMVTFRMNELHDVDKPDSPLLGAFWKAHPEYRVGGYEGWGKEALNYAIPAVRDYFFAILKEVAGRYSLDGLELDFMRFPYYFPYHADSMKHYARVMTGFVERVRRMTDSIGSVRGKKILLSARVPTSLKGCAHLGVDPAEWSRRGLIDFLTVAPFLSTETDIPVAEFKAVCGDVPIYTGIEFTIGARQMTREEKRAAAALLYKTGSDGIYLFNYFVAWDAGLEADTKALPELTHPDSLIGKDKLYTIAIPRYPVPGVSLPGQLPLQLKKGDEKKGMIRTHEPVRPKALVIRIECADTIAAGDLRLRLNGKELQNGVTPASEQIFAEKIWPSLPVREKTLEFTANPALLKEVNDLTIHANKGITVEWVYLGVRH
ncbi:MAG: right-handed parallel beta-helix repeat-containing protein [bacterium]